MRRLFSLLALCLVFLAIPGPSQLLADTAAPPSTSAPADPPAKLADALKIAAPPDPGQLVLAINGDWFSAPKDAAPLGTSPHFPQIAADYGMKTQTYGTVSAIAPVNMTILNTAPGEPDIYADMPTYAAFTLLLASLTDQQWNEIISSNGLGLSDLNTDWQKKLMNSLLSKNGTLTIQPHYMAGQQWNQADVLDETAQIPQCRIKISLTVNLNLPIKDSNGSYYGGEWAPPADGSRVWEIGNRGNYGGSSSTAYGSVVKAEVPNVLKPSQLDYSAPILRTRIPLAGLKSVGDLFARISSITHIEIYADKRLDQSLQLLGNVPAVPASDLLRAVALCQMATYRQVGPAFILTDDIAGVGTRKLLWLQYDKVAENMRSGPVRDAAHANAKNHDAMSIPWADSESQMSPDELKENPNNSLYGFDTTFDKLTSGQQAIAQREETEFNTENKDNPYNHPITTDGNIRVEPAISVQLLVPGVADPVDMEINGMGGIQAMMVFEPESNNPRAQQQAIQGTPPSEDQVATVAQLTISQGRQKAVISHARTAAGVDADIAAAKQLGMTQLWLDVFSDGNAHIPGSALSDLPAPLKPGQNDILTEAIAKGKHVGIAVYALMDLFYWGATPPDGLQDLNIFGETSTQEEARWNQRNALMPPGSNPQEYFMTGAIVPIFPGVAVAQTNADVRADLIGIAKLISSHMGVVGVVLRDTDPPGYDHGTNDLNSSESPDFELGYVPSARLAFLRQYHMDPVDLYPTGSWMGIADTNLPNFSEDNGWTSGLTNDGTKEWSQFRRKANLDLLRAIAKSAMPADPVAAKSFVVMVKQRRHGQTISYGLNDFSFGDGWYGSWDAFAGDPPTYHGYEDADPKQVGFRPESDQDQAKQESRVVMTPITHEDIARSAKAIDSAYYKKYLAARPVVPGIVLDLSGDPFGDNGNGSDPITNLAGFVMKVKKVNPAAVAGAGK
jgi:hypothetical protein